jgi:hypothetical protein
LQTAVTTLQTDTATEITAIGTVLTDLQNAPNITPAQIAAIQVAAASLQTIDSSIDAATAQINTAVAAQTPPSTGPVAGQRR